MSTNKTKKAVIIGAGFGGLAAGIRLQSQGFNTLILEKNAQPGGQAQQYSEAGYTFDMGPSIITEPAIIEAVFKCAGKTLADYIELRRLDPFYRIYFHDGTFVDYSSDIEALKAQLAQFNAKDAAKLDDFIAYSQKMYSAVITQGLGRTPFNDFGAMLKFAPFAVYNRAFLSAYSVAASYFEDFRARFLFSFHSLFIGGSPFNAPAVFLMLPYLEISQGVWFAQGGMYSLVKALEQIYTDLGGELKLNTEVTHLHVVEDKICAVETAKHKFDCDLVISNAHFAHTYKDLLAPQHRKKWTDKKIESLDYSMSCVLLYLGVTKQYAKLKHHTLVISQDYKKLVDELFANTHLPDDFSLYIHAPSKTDPTLAPAGCESIYILIPTPNLKADINWEVAKDAFADKILTFLEQDFGLDGLTQAIQVQKIFTPADFEHLRNNYLGAAWSLQPKLTQIASFRPHSKSEEVSNLYLVGASTHPGGGVPGVLLSAEATTAVILKDYEIN